MHGLGISWNRGTTDLRRPIDVAGNVLSGLLACNGQLITFNLSICVMSLSLIVI